ncbi:hypothetical protein V6R21_11735 [Limibacter armeniacum]|uniref:hypothetical protein n=1 Tax=Limibacter armeniacum TaxID=466084 RepID=UPI002FE6BE2B
MMDFTLTYDGVTQTVEDPRGWDELVISLERDKSTHGVFYSFLETELGFIGQGRKFLRNALNSEGIDAQVMLEIKEDGSILYDGLVDFSDYNDDGTFLEVSVEESGVRQMLKARFKDKVQIPESYAKDIELHSREIMLTTQFNCSELDVNNVSPLYGFAKLSIVSREFETQQEDLAPTFIFCMDEADEGEWIFKFRITDMVCRNSARMSILYYGDGASPTDTFPVFEDISNQTISEFKQDVSLTMEYSKYVLISVTEVTNWSEFELTVQQSNTTESPSIGKVISIHDAMEGVCDQIFEQVGKFTSTALGTAGSYEGYGLLSGFMVRNFPLADKPFQTSLKDLYEGAAAVFCLGLGLDGDKVVVEKMRHFYDKYTTALTLDYVSVKEEVIAERYWSNVKVGYQKYYEEDIANANNPICGELEYTTQLLAIENELELRSKFVADQYMLEVTRRKPYADTTTSSSKHDKETFIVHYYQGGDGKFYSVAGHPDGRLVDKVLSPETLYNFSIIPWENLRRWLDFIKSAYLNRSKNIRLISHEGNIEMREDLLVKTKTDQPMFPYNAIFQPVRYTVESPMNRSQLSQVVAGKYGVVRFSESNQDHKEGFIEKVKFDAGKGMATLQLIGL